MKAGTSYAEPNQWESVATIYRSTEDRGNDVDLRPTRRISDTRHVDTIGVIADDPVKVYLEQIGQISLLERDQEIRLAKQIDHNRQRFRHGLLQFDFVLRQAVRMLRRVLDGTQPFDRIVQVAVGARLEKHQIEGRIPHNLLTLEAILQKNREDFRVALRRNVPLKERRRAWKELQRRRRRAIRLVEELGLRIEHLEPFQRRLEKLNRQARQLRSRMDSCPDGPDRQRLRKKYFSLLLATQQTPSGIRREVARLNASHKTVSTGQERVVRRQSATGGFGGKEVSSPWTLVFGPHSRGQRRSNAGRREVRASAGLQILHICHVVDSTGHQPSCVRSIADDTCTRTYVYSNRPSEGRRHEVAA